MAFTAAANEMRFRLADLRAPIRTADDRLLTILKIHCQDVLDRHDAPPPTLIERVERLVVDRLTVAAARLDTVASELGMSKRTLSRRLGDLGTSFNEIVERLRRELALTYLRDSGLSQTEIAFLLGYAEVSSFNQAFRRWTGMTPGEMRRGGGADTRSS